jgi:hypothetical protein
MTTQLREELTKRKRVWGQHNSAILERMRDGKADNCRWPLRPYRVLGCGAYLVFIPRAP